MALGTTLPPWPALLFTYLEPLSLLLGAHAAISTPSLFISSQLPLHTPSSPIPQSSIILSYSIGSLFLLLAGFALLCTVVTRDTSVTKYYLLLLMGGDVGHLLANYYGMGGGVFWAWREWNEVMWGNIAVTVFLCVNRGLTLWGVFGRPGWVVGERGSRKGKR